MKRLPDVAIGYGDVNVPEMVRLPFPVERTAEADS
jgi:hypothetical protein